jgi:hypothetical protein
LFGSTGGVLVDAGVVVAVGAGDPVAPGAASEMYWIKLRIIYHFLPFLPLKNSSTA